MMSSPVVFPCDVKALITGWQPLEQRPLSTVKSWTWPLPVVFGAKPDTAMPIR